MFKSVVLATDGSDHSKRAAAIAADTAAAFKARLTLVTVLPRSMTLEDIEAAPQARRLPRDARKLMKRIHDTLRESRTVDADVHQFVPALPLLQEALAKLILDEAEAVAERRKVTRVSRVVDHGDAASQILKQAKRAKADLIVMGTRGLSNFRGLPIGSVSNKVIHDSKSAVLTVK